MDSWGKYEDELLLNSIDIASFLSFLSKVHINKMTFRLKSEKYTVMFTPQIHVEPPEVLMNGGVKSFH